MTPSATTDASGVPGAVASRARKTRGAGQVDCALSWGLLSFAQVRTLVLAGVAADSAADSCITFTALDAYVRGYQFWIPRDCVAGESARVERTALDHLARVARAVTDPARFALDAALALAQRRHA